MRKDYSEYEEIKVTANPGEVQCLTQQGWTLIDIRGSQEVAAGYSEIWPPSEQPGNCPSCNGFHQCHGHTPTPETIHGSVVLTRALFIMGKEENTVVEELREQLRTSENAVKNHTHRIGELEDEVNNITREVEDVKDSNGRTYDLLKKKDDELQDAKEKIEKAAGDIQKAKDFMGQDNWNKHVVGE